MPKLKPSNIESKSRIIRSIISQYMELYGMDEEHIAARIHFTKRTFQNKRKNPETFTLSELWKLVEILKLSEEEKAQIL